MKKLIVALFIGAAAVSAHASEYGCKVLLCLANPASNGGPKGVSECVPPIDQLYHDLSKGRPFPTCDLADGNDGSSYARQVYDPYDPCPAPLQPAARGSYVVQGQKKTGGNKPGWWGGDGSYTLSGQPQVSESQSDYDHSSGARACVGKSVGSYTVGSYDSSDTVDVFDKVVWQPAQNPRAIDVFIDNTWQQRVRW
ncbi:hypothetical protein LN457_07175 [Xanthomonas phaseoli]|uniref:hypothetical protein n=1 Tax=Xanthomonas TaxID=338 RepID=UPI0002DD70EF|nr:MULTISPECIES: hypothetical protein [Xanthomonas]MCC8532593.1 hypothetical protein [Xanthomonas phaseoli]WOB37379.1 hypothetical protein NYR96_22270 [Xanthomonas hortorum pv. pelargonii]